MGKRLVVSIHDFSPKFNSELEEILKELDNKEITTRSILCVPDWEFKHPLVKDTRTLGMIEQEINAGNEICLHGYAHTKKKKYREFRDLHPTSAKLYLMRAKKELARVNIYPTGFVAPYWKISPENEMKVKEEGFRFSATNPELFDLRNGIVYASKPIWCWPYSKSMDYGFRAFNHFLAKVYNKNNDLVRVAIHPDDVRKSKPFRHTLKLLDKLRKGRELCSYESYLDMKR